MEKKYVEMTKDEVFEKIEQESELSSNGCYYFQIMMIDKSENKYDAIYTKTIKAKSFENFKNFVIDNYSNFELVFNGSYPTKKGYELGKYLEIYPATKIEFIQIKQFLLKESVEQYWKVAISLVKDYLNLKDSDEVAIVGPTSEEDINFNIDEDPLIAKIYTSTDIIFSFWMECDKKVSRCYLVKEKCHKEDIIVLD